MKKLSLILLVSCLFTESAIVAVPDASKDSSKKEQSLSTLLVAGKTVARTIVPGIAGYVAANVLAGTNAQLILAGAALSPLLVNNDSFKKNETLETVKTASGWFFAGMLTQKAASHLPYGYTRSLLRVRD